MSKKAICILSVNANNENFSFAETLKNDSYDIYICIDNNNNFLYICDTYNNRVRKVDLIDRNFVSKKVIYGFDSKNLEAYNNLDYTKDFFLSNVFSNTKFEIFNYDKDKLPDKIYDIIISLFSLDFHYPFSRIQPRLPILILVRLIKQYSPSFYLFL